jgi:hypothetical protein
MPKGQAKYMRVGLAFDMKIAAQVLKTDYVMKYGFMRFTELQNGERVHRGPMISLERNDPNRNVRQLREIGQALQLRTHHGWAAPLPEQY